MKLDELRASDEFGQRIKFTMDEAITLALFIHDKAHALNRYKSKHTALEKALKNFSEKAPDLYRGVYKQELKKLEVGRVFSPGAYMSLSEKRSIAEGFSKRAGTNTILHVKGLHAFPYWKWNIEHLQLPLKKKDPEAFKMNDGEHAINSLKNEAEWIVGHDTQLKVVSKREDGNFTIIEVTEA